MMSSFLRRALLLGAASLALAPLASAREYRLTVPAAPEARAGQLVSFLLPADAPKPAVLKDAHGAVVALQPGDAGRVDFVVAHQPAATALTFTLTAGEAADHVRVARGEEGRTLDLTTEGRPLLSYWTGERPLPRPDIKPAYLRSGFIHPVFTPAGVAVTASYAVGHAHHHGIWSPWTKTRFQGRTPDFWNMGTGGAKVEFASLEREWSGPVHAGFVTHHRFIDQTGPAPVVALNETWVVTAYDLAGTGEVRPARVIDLVITQTCATNDPLILPEYHYGGLGYRGRDEWNGAELARFLTSEGITDRVKAHGTRARWCHVGGEAAGQFVGTAILGHPGNFRAPQPMRIHPTEPFFCYAPSQLGDWQITPGTPYVARYRFIVMDGPPDRALIDAYWNGYAAPADATVEGL